MGNLTNTISIEAPYLIFVGDVTQRMFAKTGLGLVEWVPEKCAGQLRLTEDAVDIGLPDMRISDALAAGVRTLVIGTAAIGGGVPEHWLSIFVEAARAGLSVAGGMHSRLRDNPQLAEAAASSGARLIDVRDPPAGLPVGTGKKRKGRRLLTVGTDCALGKKYTALQLERDMRAAGKNATFRASGQTGIMISGQGLPIDAVVADFISGAAETLSPVNDPLHWDVIEGQGALHHPGYGAVSYGLLLGSQPDAIVVCHEAGRTHITGWPHVTLPEIGEVIASSLAAGRQVNPEIRCVGISVNTSSLPDTVRAGYLARLSEKYGLPCVDPLIGGTGAIVSRIEREFPAAYASGALE